MSVCCASVFAGRQNPEVPNSISKRTNDWLNFISTQEEFEKTAEDARTVIPSSIPSDEQLKLYGLFKQAKVGDNETSRPGILDQKGRSKWDAWTEQKGKDKETAMREYIAYVEELKQKYSKIE